MQITAGFAEGALRLVARSGGSADRVKARAKYRAPSPAAAGLLESQEIGRLLECCAAELDDPYFGLRLGATLDLRALGTISYAIANARPAGECINPWVLNLRASGFGMVRVRGEMLRVVAHELDDAQIELWWQELVEVWPAFGEHYAATGERAVFVLEPVDE